MIDSQAARLYKLQVIDLAIAHRRTRLAEIDAKLGKNEAVAQARLSLDAADKALKPWQTRARDLDLEIKGISEKIQTTDRSLYSGRISNPKELQDMQNELASLQRHKSQLEDEALDAMMKTEEAQAVVGEAQAVLDKAQALWAGSQVDLIDEKRRLEAEIADQGSKRQQAAAAVEHDSLTKYEALRIRKRGQAVAMLKGDSCSACGVEQTSQIATHVRQGTVLTYCASCGRLLAAI